MDTDRFIAEVLCSNDVKYTKFYGDFGQYADVFYNDNTVGYWYRKRGCWGCHNPEDYSVNAGSVLTGRE